MNAALPIPAAERASPPRASVWTFLQLADSAFPTGGFAHSAGLEAACQHGEIPNTESLRRYLSHSLSQAVQALAPFVSTVHDNPERIAELDELCDVWTTNHVANRASRAQGRSLINAVERIFNLKLRDRSTSPFHGHHAPWFGRAALELGFAKNDTLQLFLFNHLRGLTSSAVRLGIVGPTEGQTLQNQLASELDTAVAHAQTLTLDDLAQTSPLHDLWQGAQDRLYSRLFQS